jgi:hypothetical protein
MGRSSKFDLSRLEEIKILYASGKTDEQVADFLGVSSRTLNTWKGRHAIFLQTLKDAKAQADDMVEAALFQRAIGYTHIEEKVQLSWGEWKTIKVAKHLPPDPIACIFWLKNRRPDRWRDKIHVEDETPKQIAPEVKKTFEQFCSDAGYPPPYPKQVEMRAFAIDNSDPRMLLGSRGYGKTDYVTVLGAAYEIYKDPLYTILIITKSKSRNTAIMGEITSALEKNGVTLDKSNSSCVRARGLVGKDHSVEAVTIKTSLRGRHPKLVIMDDPVTEEDISEAMRRTVKTKYNEVMKLCSNVVVIGQPAHKFDLYAELRPIVKKLEIRYGEIPELDHDLEAQRLAGVDESSIQASYFLNVVSEDQSPFDKVNYLDNFPVSDSAVAFLDPSFKGGDYTALSVIKGHFQGIAVQGHVWKKAWNHCVEIDNGIVHRLKELRVKKLAVECNSLGDLPVAILSKALEGSGIGVVGVSSNTNKHSRIMAAGAFAPLIHLSKESDKIYLDQTVRYEYGCKNDDAPDSLASGMKWIGLIKGKENE